MRRCSPVTPGWWRQLSWSIGGGVAPALLTALYDANSSLPWIVLVLGCAAATVALRSTALRPPPTPPTTGRHPAVPRLG